MESADLAEARSAVKPTSLANLNEMILQASPFVPGGKRPVLGEGPAGAALALVGEQPGDQEDIEGRPFVGPSGSLLDEALESAGIQRSEIYLTNAVKHFKFAQRGKRRLHQRPTAGEISHYRWWLELELGFVDPRVVVALGATAVYALTGKKLSINANRGRTSLAGRPGYITAHPSYVLRLADPSARKRAFRTLVLDLSRARMMSETQLN